jgi:hypothetical protein
MVLHVFNLRQYSVTLQSQEVVPEKKRCRIGGHQSKLGDEAVVTSYSKHHEFWYYISIVLHFANYSE